MSSLQEQVRKFRWKSLEHAYGRATDTPGLLLKLLSEDEEERELAFESLCALLPPKRSPNIIPLKPLKRLSISWWEHAAQSILIGSTGAQFSGNARRFAGAHDFV